MTASTGQTAAARRPSPYPPSVTDGNSPVSTGEFGSAPVRGSAQVGGLEVSSLQSTLHPTAVTVRDRLWGWLRASRAYWTPPAVLTEPPASAAQLAAYAWRGGWTGGVDGPVRRLGVWWHRLVGLPVTVVCRYVEWVAQRPGRAVPVYVLWRLFVLTTAGQWAMEHLIRPVLGLAAWVLL